MVIRSDINSYFDQRENVAPFEIDLIIRKRLQRDVSAPVEESEMTKEKTHCAGDGLVTRRNDVID